MNRKAIALLSGGLDSEIIKSVAETGMKARLERERLDGKPWFIASKSLIHSKD